MPPSEGTAIMEIAREHMADAIGTMQSECARLGMSYTEEMTALVLAWLYTHHGMGNGTEVLIEAPIPDDGQESPGHLLLRCAVDLPLDLLTLDDLAPPPLEARIPCPLRRQPRIGPPGRYADLVEPMQDVLEGRRPELRIELSEINLKSLRVRCYLIGNTSRTHKLTTEIVGDTLRVTRIKR